MKPVFKHKVFDKNFKKRIQGNKNLEKDVEIAIRTFLTDRKNPRIADHSLIGNMKPKRSFSVRGDLRIVYYELEDKFLFLDIGSHNQVY